MTHLRRRLLIIASIFIAAGVVFVGGAGEFLSRPVLHPVGVPPAQLAAESFVLPATQGRIVAGWMVRGKPGAGVVLLLHGVRNDRREMQGRAEFLARLGYSVVLIDLPAHGESTAEHITYGITESEGVKATLDYIAREFKGERVGVVGVSLGAASLVLARPDPAPAAIVLESMFPTINEAVSNRLQLYLGTWARPFSPLLLQQLPWRLGIPLEQLCPIEALPELHAPLLIVSGSIDRHTTEAETRQLFGAANQPKELWIIEGAAHVNLYHFTPREYEARISAFFAQHLRNGSPI